MLRRWAHVGITKVSAWLVLTILALLSLGVLACEEEEAAPSTLTPAAGTTPATRPLESIKIGYAPIIDAAHLFLAQEKGFFRDAGFPSVELRSMAGGAALIPAMEAGEINIAFSNVVSLLQAREQGIKVVCFASALRKPSMGRNLALLASPRSQASSVSDLRGQTIAVNTLGNINELIARVLLARNGVDPRQVTFRGIPFPEMPQALAQGQVAAALVEDPALTAALNQGARLLVNRTYEVITPNPVFSCWFALEDWLATHEQEVRAFLRAIQRAADEVRRDNTEALSLLPKYTGINVQQLGEAGVPDFRIDVSPDDLRPWMDAAVQQGMLRGPIDLSTLVRPIRP